MRPHRLRTLSLRFGLVSALLVVAAAAQHAHAVVGELAYDVGRPLLTYAGASDDEGLRTLILNGARLRMRTGTTRDSIDQALDALSAPCGLEPAIRTQRADQGWVGCIVPVPGTHLVERLQAFATTGDLAALGELRVTWAMQIGTRVRYVAMASEGTLELAGMFPASGDAPGADVPGLTRPPRARRIVSAWQDQAAPMLVSYRSAMPVEQLEHSYRATLTAAGEHVERVPGASGGEPLLLIRRGERSALAILARDDTGTLISIVPFADHTTEPRGAR